MLDGFYTSPEQHFTELQHCNCLVSTPQPSSSVSSSFTRYITSNMLNVLRARGYVSEVFEVLWSFLNVVASRASFSGVHLKLRWGGSSTRNGVSQG